MTQVRQFRLGRLVLVKSSVLRLSGMQWDLLVREVACPFLSGWQLARGYPLELLYLAKEQEWVLLLEWAYQSVSKLESGSQW